MRFARGGFADVGIVKSVNILFPRNRLKHGFLIEMSGQRQLQQDSMDGGVRVQFFNQRDQDMFFRFIRQRVGPGRDSARFVCARLGSDIDPTCWIAADQDDSQARRNASLTQNLGSSGNTPLYGSGQFPTGKKVVW